jgi:[protein-PII] uridylyltransferase
MPSKRAGNRVAAPTDHTPAIMPWRADFEWGPTDADGVAHPPSGFVNDFAAAMPSRYGVLFDPRTIRKHAAISYRRGTRRAHVEVWRALPDGSAALCVIAEDRPGLLSAVAAALVQHRLDVITALVFSRALSSGPSAAEAVDLVWVRRASLTDTAAIGADEAVSIGEVLSAILSGSISVDQIAPQRPLSAAAATAGDTRTIVRFDPTDDDNLAALLVEAPDRPGMLLTIARELFQHGAQIVRSLVRTADGRAFNRFELTEFNGGRLAPERREQISAGVLTALSLVEPADASAGVVSDGPPLR